MLKFNKTFSVNIGNKKYKKVKGAPYFCSELNRNLFIHQDIDNDKQTSVSDEITGYRLFFFKEKYDKIKEEDIRYKIDEYIKHYSIPLIEHEFNRVEKLLELKNE